MSAFPAFAATTAIATRIDYSKEQDLHMHAPHRVPGACSICQLLEPYPLAPDNTCIVCAVMPVYSLTSTRRTCGWPATAAWPAPPPAGHPLAARFTSTPTCDTCGVRPRPVHQEACDVCIQHMRNFIHYAKGETMPDLDLATNVVLCCITPKCRAPLVGATMQMHCQKCAPPVAAVVQRQLPILAAVQSPLYPLPPVSKRARKAIAGRA